MWLDGGVEREEYITLLQGLLSRDPGAVRDANRRLYAVVVDSPRYGAPGTVPPDNRREADLVLAELGN